jgi:hypothetical protein
MSKESEFNIPSITLDTLERYVEHGCPTGGFLRAVLENKLVESFSRADTENKKALEDIVYYLYNHIPHEAWGSEENCDTWIERRGMEYYKGTGNGTL